MYRVSDWFDYCMSMLIERDLAAWICSCGYFFLCLFLAATATAFYPLFGPTITVYSFVIGAILMFFWPVITIGLVHLIDTVSKIRLDK